MTADHRIVKRAIVKLTISRDPAALLVSHREPDPPRPGIGAGEAPVKEPGKFLLLYIYMT